MGSSNSVIPLSNTHIDTDDAWIEDLEAESESSPLNRQARRKAKRERAKANKRRGQLVAMSAGDSMPDIVQDPISSSHQLSSENHPEDPTDHGPLSEHSEPFDAAPSPSRWMESHLITSPPVAPPEKHDAPLAALEHRPLPGEQPQIDVSEICEMLALAEPIAEAERDFVTSSRLQASANLEESTEVADNDIAPLARNRALSDPNARLLTKLKLWIMRMMAPHENTALAAEASYPVDQLREVQNDLAEVQRRIDIMLVGARKEGTGQ